MVGLAFDDGAGAIELLGEDEAHHLVAERHGREGEAFVGAGVDVGGESVGAADEEDETSGGLLLLL